MKSVLSLTAAIVAVLASTGCSQMPQMPFMSQRQAPQQNTAATPSGAQTNYASDGASCNARAQSRMSMYDRPSTYPISDQERHDAYTALYSECMHEHNWQVAGAAHRSAPATDPSQLAALSPAAGGPSRATTIAAGNTLVTESATPGATVLVIGGNPNSAAQLSSLSPSSGGAYSGATVILVQSPQASARPAGYYAPPAAALPVAIPIAPPMAKGAYAPVAQAMPQPTMTPPAQSYALQPSLATADAYSSSAMTPPAPPAPAEQGNSQQLENVLEK